MNLAAKLTVASIVALSCVAPALAQEENTLAERNVYLFMNGHMIQTHVTSDAMHATIMKNFKPLKNGTMIYVNGGKLYIGEDRKMHGGQMMSTEIFGRDLGIGRER